jgi:hypothetical protein
MGSRVCQLLATLCVSLSLALFAPGSADPTGGFSLRTLSYSRPTAIMGPILDTVVIYRSVEGMLCEESRGRVSVYNALYCILKGSIASLPRL